MPHKKIPFELFLQIFEIYYGKKISWIFQNFRVMRESVNYLIYAIIKIVPKYSTSREKIGGKTTNSYSCLAVTSLCWVENNFICFLSQKKKTYWESEIVPWTVQYCQQLPSLLQSYDLSPWCRSYLFPSVIIQSGCLPVEAITYIVISAAWAIQIQLILTTYNLDNLTNL